MHKMWLRGYRGYETATLPYYLQTQTRASENCLLLVLISNSQPHKFMEEEKHKMQTILPFYQLQSTESRGKSRIPLCTAYLLS